MVSGVATKMVDILRQCVYAAPHTARDVAPASTNALTLNATCAGDPWAGTCATEGGVCHRMYDDREQKRPPGVKRCQDIHDESNWRANDLKWNLHGPGTRKLFYQEEAGGVTTLPTNDGATYHVAAFRNVIEPHNSANFRSTDAGAWMRGQESKWVPASTTSVSFMGDPLDIVRVNADGRSTGPVTGPKRIRINTFIKNQDCALTAHSRAGCADSNTARCGSSIGPNEHALYFKCPGKVASREFSLVGSGACRDGEGRYFPWGTATVSPAAARTACSAQATCMGYMATGASNTGTGTTPASVNFPLYLHEKDRTTSPEVLF